jgi:hypothetical protein
MKLLFDENLSHKLVGFSLTYFLILFMYVRLA